VDNKGIEPLPLGCRPSVLPLSLIAHLGCLVGYDPTLPGPQPGVLPLNDRHHRTSGSGDRTRTCVNWVQASHNCRYMTPEQSGSEGENRTRVWCLPSTCSATELPRNNLGPMSGVEPPFRLYEGRVLATVRHGNKLGGPGENRTRVLTVLQTVALPSWLPIPQSLGAGNETRTRVSALATQRTSLCTIPALGSGSGSRTRVSWVETKGTSRYTMPEQTWQGMGDSNSRITIWRRASWPLNEFPVPFDCQRTGGLYGSPTRVA
jgi:hypothetical protein